MTVSAKVVIDLDIFDSNVDELNPRAVALAAWSEISDWISGGLAPHLSIAINDGDEVVVDLGTCTCGEPLEDGQRECNACTGTLAMDRADEASAELMNGR